MSLLQDREVIKNAIRREVDRGGQIFFVHNRIQTIEFYGSHTPPKANILRFGGKLIEPFCFEAERNLKIIIELEDGPDSLQQFERAIEILAIWE